MRMKKILWDSFYIILYFYHIWINATAMSCYVLAYCLIKEMKLSWIVMMTSLLSWRQRMWSASSGDLAVITEQQTDWQNVWRNHRVEVGRRTGGGEWSRVVIYIITSTIGLDLRLVWGQKWNESSLTQWTIV